MSRALGITEDQLMGELYVAWLKDVRERPGPQTLKKYQEVMEKALKDRDVVLRKQHIGVNVSITLSSLLAGPNIVKLDLYENTLRDTGCEAVSHLLRESQNLVHLNLGGNDIGSQGITMLATVIPHRRIQTLILGSADGDPHVNRMDTNAAKTLVEALSRCRTLKVLDLSRNPIGRGSQDAFPMLAQLVAMSTSLQVLKLGGTEMQPESGLAIAQAVAKSTTIAHLDLHDNYLTHHTADALGRILAERASRGASHSLKSILLHDNVGLGERGAPVLFKPLATDKSVNYVNLSGCNVSDEGLLALCNSLITNQVLTQLDLHDNHITEEGAVELARALLKHPGLTDLNVSKNKIKDDGACALASMLETNTQIESLNLDSCGVGDRGVIAIGVSLATNKTLTNLVLNNNHISEDGGTAFASLLEKNRSVQNCGLKGNSMFHCTMLAALKVSNRNKQAKQDEIPNQLRKEVIQLHYQLYKLEEAKNELAVQQQNKKDADDKQQSYDDQHRAAESQFREDQKKLRDQLKEHEDSIKHRDTEIKTLSERFQQFQAAHEQDMIAQKERLEIETKEREEAEAERDALQEELNNAAAVKEKKVELLKQKILEAKEEKQKWADQADDIRTRYVEAQKRVEELEKTQQTQQKAAEDAAAAAAKPKPGGKGSKPKPGASDINALLADS